MASKELGKAIQRMRKATGISQQQLAAKLDVDPTYISHLERGHREPSIQLLRKIADELQIPTGLFLAIALASDLPPEQKAMYAPVLTKLVDLAAVTQLKLGLD